MPRARLFQPRSPSRRVTVWGQGPQAVDQSLSANGSTLWTNGSVLVLDSRTTIVRLRGRLHIHLTVATAAGDGFAGAVGIGVASLAAFTAGIGSVPTLLTELAWNGWMWHQMIDIRTNTTTLADGVNAVAADLNIEIDSKAMRKFGEEEVLYGAIELQETGIATMILHADVRVLDKTF